MRGIVAEGAQFYYFTLTDPAALETVIGLRVALVPPFMARQLAIATDFRLILQRAFPNDTALVYYLHWDNDQDLKEVDQNVNNDTYTDVDFVRSIKTVFQITICDGCKHSWRTLVAPTGDPYVGAPNLNLRKLGEHIFVHSCPRCGTSFRQLVAKIFKDAGQ